MKSKRLEISRVKFNFFIASNLQCNPQSSAQMTDRTQRCAKVWLLLLACALQHCTAPNAAAAAALLASFSTFCCCRFPRCRGASVKRVFLLGRENEFSTLLRNYIIVKSPFGRPDFVWGKYQLIGPMKSIERTLEFNYFWKS